MNVGRPERFEVDESREVTLIPGLTSDREARFLEERRERRIGRATQPVPGELPH